MQKSVSLEVKPLQDWLIESLLFIQVPTHLLELHDMAELGQDYILDQGLGWHNIFEKKNDEENPR